MSRFKKNEEVLVFYNYRLNPDISFVSGFFNGSPVVNGVVFSESLDGCFPENPEGISYVQIEKITEELKEKISLEKAKKEFLSLQIYDDVSKYKVEDFKEVIALHKKILAKNGAVEE